MEAKRNRTDGRGNDAQSESRFYMWRTVFAVAHADNFLALEEQGMLAGHLDRQTFSKEQLAVLREDMATPQDVETMFRNVTDPADQEEFFDLVRKLVWVDGKLDEREKALVARLESVRAEAMAIKAAHEAHDGGFVAGLIGKLTGKGRKK